MAKLSDLMNMEASVTVAFQGIPVTAHYNPALLTIEFFERVQALQDTKDDETTEQHLVVTLVKMMITRWDLTDDDGTPLPIDEATLRKLPMALLNELITTIQEGVSVPKAS